MTRSKPAAARATLVPLDLKDFPALDRLGASIFERWGKLDAFLGNAGVLGVLTPLAHLDPKVFQEALDVNVTANWRHDPFASIRFCAVPMRAARCS